MKTLRTITILLLLFVALNAVVAGYLFMIDPSGTKLHMHVSWLSNSPFSNFLIPGIILFMVNGIFNLLVATATVLKLKNHARLIVVQGILLICWIITQIILTQHLHFLHFFLVGIGIALFMLGNRLDV